jgi:hypothetical protein
MKKKAIASLPIYTQVWNSLKHFPKGLKTGSKHPPATSGGAAAFLISGGIGAVAMMTAHHLAETSKAREALLKTLGSWIPGSVSRDPMWGSIGSYAGKETVMLIAWLGSLTILYPLLKNRSLKPRTIFFWMFSLYTLAAAMSWHPLFPYLTLQ